MKRAPVLSFKDLDLFRLYTLVQREGGAHVVRRITLLICCVLENIRLRDQERGIKKRIGKIITKKDSLAMKKKPHAILFLGLKVYDKQLWREVYLAMGFSTLPTSAIHCITQAYEKCVMGLCSSLSFGS